MNRTAGAVSDSVKLLWGLITFGGCTSHPRAASSSQFRIGHGYDLHRLEPPPLEGQGRPPILGGVHLEHSVGPVGHSDGDAVLHAVTDAMLGASPPRTLDSSPMTIGNAGRDSRGSRAAADQRAFSRVDAGQSRHHRDLRASETQPHKQAMIANIAGMLGCGTIR